MRNTITRPLVGTSLALLCPPYIVHFIVGWARCVPTSKVRRCITITMLVISSLLTACGSSPSLKKITQDTYTVAIQPFHKTLYFTGTLQPLHESTLTSPVDAVVESMPWHYGQSIKKGDVVFTLNSAELQRQYNDTLTDYLKAKDSYSIAKAKFTGTEDLWGAGLISKNNYLNEKSGLNTARITLMQATHKLSDMLDKMGDAPDNQLTNLSFAEFDKVRLALTRQHNLIRLKSSRSGVLLYPPKSTAENSPHITVGSAVKAGQVLALIGDLSGVSVEIDIPEVDITEIKPGMQATVRGVAFGKQALHGKLVVINAQASASSGNGNALPSFTALVEVKALTRAQQSRLKVGMSAAVELDVNSTDKLLVPLAAIQQKSGKSMVQIQMPDGKTSMQPVTTGPVHNDNVVIESGLKAGDVVILCH